MPSKLVLQVFAFLCSNASSIHPTLSPDGNLSNPLFCSVVRLFVSSLAPEGLCSLSLPNTRYCTSQGMDSIPLLPLPPRHHLFWPALARSRRLSPPFATSPHPSLPLEAMSPHPAVISSHFPSSCILHACVLIQFSSQASPLLPYPPNSEPGFSCLQP